MSAPTGRGRTVSGSLSLPSRGAFHLSLAVLVHCRSPGSVLPWRMVPPDSRRVPRAPRYSGYRMVRASCAYGPLTLRGAAFQRLPLRRSSPSSGPTTPERPRPHGFGLLPFRSPLLGESLLFSSPAATKMFQFAAFASLAGSPCGGVPPFGHPRIKGLLRLPAAFRSFTRPSSPPGARASSVRPSQSSPGGARHRCQAPRSTSHHVNVPFCPSPGRPREGGWRISDSNR